MSWQQVQVCDLRKIRNKRNSTDDHKGENKGVAGVACIARHELLGNLEPAGDDAPHGEQCALQPEVGRSGSREIKVNGSGSRPLGHPFDNFFLITRNFHSLCASRIVDDDARPAYARLYALSCCASVGRGVREGSAHARECTFVHPSMQEYLVIFYCF